MHGFVYVCLRVAPIPAYTKPVIQNLGDPGDPELMKDLQKIFSKEPKAADLDASSGEDSGAGDSEESATTSVGPSAKLRAEIENLSRLIEDAKEIQAGTLPCRTLFFLCRACVDTLCRNLFKNFAVIFICGSYSCERRKIGDTQSPVWSRKR